MAKHQINPEAAAQMAAQAIRNLFTASNNIGINGQMLAASVDAQLRGVRSIRVEVTNVREYIDNQCIETDRVAARASGSVRVNLWATATQPKTTQEAADGIIAMHREASALR